MIPTTDELIAMCNAELPRFQWHDRLPQFQWSNHPNNYDQVSDGSIAIAYGTPKYTDINIAVKVSVEPLAKPPIRVMLFSGSYRLMGAEWCGTQFAEVPRLIRGALGRYRDSINYLASK